MTIMSHRRPLLCATLTASRTAELSAQRDRVQGADLIEMRLDTVVDPHVGAALAARRLPTIVTCRPRDEGGLFRGSEQERRTLLREAMDAGADFVDLEWRRGFDGWIRERSGRGIVLSHHDFGGVPPDLEAMVAAMAATEAEVVKVAVMVSRLSDCARLAEIGRRYPGRRLVLIGMGEAGAVTRIAPARFGSCWTYAGASAAPGQLTIEQMRREFRFARAGAGTPLYGILGRPVSHSVSPAMHNAAYDALGLDAVYVPLMAASLDDWIESADALGIRGVSITAPFKEHVLPHVAAMDGPAAAIGAVNTLTRSADGWHGANTDVAGFLAGLGETAGAGVRAAILGTGGAARAAAFALRGAGCAVTCYARPGSSAGALAAALGVVAAERPVPPGTWDLLINATPVGTHPDAGASAFPEGEYTGRLVYDLVYNPPVTRLMHDAAARGCRTIGGLEMLVEQARLQIAQWFGRLPDAAVLRDAAQWKLSTFTDPT
jgi:3-dehydroquinate dehydratase / shikimate dehydrogenase